MEAKYILLEQNTFCSLDIKVVTSVSIYHKKTNSCVFFPKRSSNIILVITRRCSGGAFKHLLRRILPYRNVRNELVLWCLKKMLSGLQLGSQCSWNVLQVCGTYLQLLTTQVCLTLVSHRAVQCVQNLSPLYHEDQTRTRIILLDSFSTVLRSSIALGRRTLFLIWRRPWCVTQLQSLALIGVWRPRVRGDAVRRCCQNLTLEIGVCIIVEFCDSSSYSFFC